GAVTRYEYNLAGQLAKVQYPESQELRDLQEKEARQHGLFWQEGVSGLSNGHLSTGEYTELSKLLVRMRNGGGFLPTTQLFRTEMYTYDANGNRATKTTAYGTITYSYDAENRLVSSGANGRVAVTYRYDSNGNLLSQTSSFTNAVYEYNPQNRMVRSRVIDDEARTMASTRYGYDVLGRRTLVQDNGATTLRTLYDGLGFDVVKESPIYSNGGFTDTYNIGIQYSSSGRATGERYRYLDDGVSATSEKYQYIEDNAYQTVSSRYAGERTMLYAHGSPVAVNRSSGTRGYLGTDILGSTRSVTDNHGVQESYYDYDIFGSPVAGDFTTGADYGYLGKPYDSITGLYNYGYRDYSPQTVRFTTVDPIRDGNNWFAYVNNDPVNYVDLWGLLASEGGRTIPNTWRDNKDGTYTALPGATLYELYGEHWREESGYSGNPADLQVGDVVGKVNIPKEYTDTQPETIHNMTDTNNSNIVRSYGFGLKMALVLGLGFEVGYIEAGETKGIYITGSYGVGVQVSTGNYSSIKELVKSPSPRSLF
ncbi:MAG: RHS repeat-associated core domain-containing protein, partial [Eubacteriales bacterium]|nr:RHS repeat-associated core domain-containing protein [Eubacteriales bacterium]